MILLLLACCQSFGQQKRRVIVRHDEHYDTVTWFNKELQSQVQDVHGSFILFNLRSKRGEYVSLHPEKPLAGFPRAHNNLYRFDFGAGAELWEKDFGRSFPREILTAQLKAFADKKGEVLWIQGKIFRDSIITVIHWNEPIMGIARSAKDGDYRVFERVTYPTGFQGGPEALQKLINDQLKGLNMNVPPTDSIIYFQGVIKKDSMIHNVELLEPTEWSPFSRKLVEIFESQRRKWLPFVREMVLNVYQIIYIRVKRDGSIEADYPND